jgi:3-deoxy-D-manno-octulosonic-acid transferase
MFNSGCPATMYFIYSVLLSLAFLILLPRFLFDAIRHGKYVAGLSERLGSLRPANRSKGPVIWIHSVSVGETQAARPLVKELKARFPGSSIAISTTTRTGQELARDIFSNDAERIFYFPFDWRWTVRRTLKAIRPSAVVILETELWPAFLRECDEQQIPVAIVNGRLSGQSFRRYRLIKRFITRVLRTVNLAIMQTETDANRICVLGMDARKVKISGNLKFDAGPTSVMMQTTQYFSERFKLDNTQLILAASTHAPEERIILESFRELRVKSPGTRLMIAPRHPERFNDVAALIKAGRFNYSRRSETPEKTDPESDVILLDTIGELQSVYSLATIVFVGGSIANTGGHNILEPAAVGACVVTGAHTHNFQAIVEKFVKADAVVQLRHLRETEAASELASTISELLDDRESREQIGSRARNLVNQNRGATRRTVEFLTPILSFSTPVEEIDSVRVQHAPTL